MRKYRLSPTLSSKRSPLAYWKDRSPIIEKSCVKKMGDLAKIYLTAPPSSCDVERLFSTVSKILNKRRNKELFVHENISKVNYQWW